MFPHLKCILLCMLGCMLVGICDSEPARRTDQFVTNGTDALPGQIPFMASIQYPEWGHTNWQHYIGGVILDSQWILTTADALDMSDRMDKVRVGATYVKMRYNDPLQPPNPDNATAGVEHDIRMRITHFDYTPFKDGVVYAAELYHDNIALVKLKTPITFDENTQPAKLPPQGYQTTGEDLLFCGWDGVLHLNNRYLQTAEIGLNMTPEECEDELYKYNSEQMMCGEVKDKKDVCRNSKGGPVVEQSSGYLVGLIVDGSCSGGWQPISALKVSAFTDWILDIIKRHP